MRPATAGFIEKQQNDKISPIFAQKALEPIVSGCYKCTIDISSSPVPATVTPAFEMRSTTVLFIKNRQNHRNSTIFSQNHLISPVSELFNWNNNEESLPMLPIAPTKHPCDMSEDFLKNFFFFFLLPFMIVIFRDEGVAKSKGAGQAQLCPEVFLSQFPLFHLFGYPISFCLTITYLFTGRFFSCLLHILLVS